MNKIIEDMPNRDYHATDDLSSSGLKELAISPAHYKSKKEQAFDFNAKTGTLFHLTVLEPEYAESRVTVIKNLRKTVGKEKRDEAIKAGRLFCNETDWNLAVQAAEGLKRNPYAMTLLQDGQNELSLFTKDPDFGYGLKIRPDSYHKEKKIICDLKTISRGMSDFDITRLIVKRRWNWQAAFYVYVNELITGEKFTFTHVFVEDKPPFATRIKVIEDYDMEKAKEQFWHLFLKFSECKKKNEWPAFENEIKPITLPDYAYGG